MKPTLLVLAAGMGSRYGGVKQIDAVGMHNETLLDFGVYDAAHSGYGKVVFIIRKDIEKDFRERLFDRIARNMDADYVFQSLDSLLTSEQVKLAADRKKPWGTIHALLCAKDAVKTPFTVINADDYYGRTAYQDLGAYLSTLENDSTAHAMVGYVLENTMSRSGSVSRGICRVKDGYLVSMEENTKIEYTADGGIVSHMDRGDEALTGKEVVSMNFFGFTPKAFDSFTPYWEAFIKDNITQAKAECLLPNAAGKMVEDGEGTIKVLTSQERWFGMTYPEDKQLVMDELRKKIQAYLKNAVQGASETVHPLHHPGAPASRSWTVLNIGRRSSLFSTNTPACSSPSTRRSGCISTSSITKTKSGTSRRNMHHHTGACTCCWWMAKRRGASRSGGLTSGAANSRDCM